MRRGLAKKNIWKMSLTSHKFFVPSPFDCCIWQCHGQTTEISWTLFPTVYWRQWFHVLETWRILDSDVTSFECCVAFISRHTLIETVIGSDCLWNEKNCGCFAQLNVLILLQNDAIVIFLLANGELFGLSISSERDWRRRSALCLACQIRMVVTNWNCHVLEFINLRLNNDVQIRLLLHIACTVLRQACIGTSIIFLNSRYRHLTFVSNDRETVG